MNYIMRTLNQFRVSNVTVNGINLMLHYVNVKSFCAFHFEKIRSRGRPLNSCKILNTVSGLKYLKRFIYHSVDIFKGWCKCFGRLSMQSRCMTFKNFRIFVLSTPETISVLYKKSVQLTQR